MKTLSRNLQFFANVLVIISLVFTWAYFSSAELRFWIADKFAQRAWYFFGDYCSASQPATPDELTTCHTGYQPARFNLINFYTPALKSGGRIPPTLGKTGPAQYMATVSTIRKTLIISSANFIPGRESFNKDARLLLVISKHECLFVDRLRQANSATQPNIVNVWVYGFIFDCQNRALQ